ncbi:MAG: cation diffusion facilitator family transporter [Lachnospiraceae bacterium]|nr:cation diffusion facilitator family transporter [Lachnospiraceae bacterium]
MEETLEKKSIGREKGITRTSIIGITANIFLVIFKALVGLISGSIAIVLDAVNNLTDAVSSIVTIVGVKMAHRAPDEKHPFGHGRIEYFSAIVIAFIIFAAGLMSLIESVKKIISPQVASFTAISLVIIIVAILIKIFLGIYVQKQGKKYYSDALIGSGKDALFDAIISVATLLGAVVTLIFHISIDGYIGVIIAGFIIKAGVEMLISPINQVVGFRPDSQLTKDIKASVKAIPGVLGAYDLILHDYGPDSAIGSVHIEIPDTKTAREIHVLTTQIQNAIYEKYHIFLSVGIYAVDTSEFAANKQAHLKEDMLKYDGVKGCHGIYIDSEMKFISFDVLIDFKVKDKVAFLEQLKKEVLEDYPGYEIKINFDIDYSD